MGLIDSYRFVPRERFKRSREYEILPDGYFDLAFLLSDSTCRIFLAGPYTQIATPEALKFLLIGPRFREDLVLGAAEIIEQHAGVFAPIS